MPLLSLICTALLPAAAPHVECRLRNGRVTVEVFYADDAPAGGAAVTVRDRAGADVAAGRADETGAWSFPCPPAGKYRVTADAGGARSEAVMTVPTATALKALSPPPEELILTAGPTRGEVTRFPWLRAALGAGALAALAAVLLAAARRPARGRPAA